MSRHQSNNYGLFLQQEETKEAKPGLPPTNPFGRPPTGERTTSPLIRERDSRENQQSKSSGKPGTGNSQF